MGTLTPILSERELNKLGILAVAQVGDAVYELMVRVNLCKSQPTAKKLHTARVKYVNAAAQAAAAQKLMESFTSDELDVFKRARNAESGSVPKAVTREVYSSATGLEAVWGYLYLSGQTERLEQLFERIWGDMQ